MAEQLVVFNHCYFPQYEVRDNLNLYGWEFTAEMKVSQKPGLASALQGGRVIGFTMHQSGDLVALYSDGKWYQKIDDDNDLAQIAMLYFLDRYNRKRTKEEEKKRGIL